MKFQARLKLEFEARRQRNARYSLRAFARFLGTDHSTLSQIIRGRRNLSSEMIRRLGGRLRLGAREIANACLQQEADTVLRLAASPEFVTDCRWISARTNIALDRVNIVLQKLLHERALTMQSTNSWKTEKASHA